jgi:hypothetical protein
VKLTLGFTIALVVLVIFAFLRSFWATVIPSITVPLALVGTFAVLYLGGYSLDNLSLMALTLAVGLVVDDAIVMLENIYRYLEKGDRLYDRVDQHLADRRLHPLVVYERHRRPALSRVRRDRRGRDRAVGDHRADLVADNGGAGVARPALGPARAALRVERARVRAHDPRV